MIDAHCHLYEIEEKEWIATDLEAMICCGAGEETSKKAIELAERHSHVWATVGVHPEEGGVTNMAELPALARRSKVVAIGECGLDYTQETTDEEKRWQKELFEFNIDLAIKLKLPLVVHCRNAFEDVYSGLRPQMSDFSGVQMHCWTGDQEWAKKFLDLGCYLSFGGIITFKKSEYLREVVKMISEDKILLETDSPYLSPEPIRGQRNTPESVKIVARLVAELRNISVEEVDTISTRNTKRLFTKMNAI